MGPGPTEVRPVPKVKGTGRKKSPLQGDRYAVVGQSPMIFPARCLGPQGPGGLLVMTWHLYRLNDDVAPVPDEIGFLYLLIIHLRK